MDKITVTPPKTNTCQSPPGASKERFHDAMTQIPETRATAYAGFSDDEAAKSAASFFTKSASEIQNPGKQAETAKCFAREAKDGVLPAGLLGKTDMGDVRLKVAAYIRVSTDSSDQENSYETQERYFTRLLSRNPRWVSAGIYSDYGLSGTNREKRTGFQRILRHCREGRIDRIVCKSISRFARNTSDFLMALQVLRDHQVTILFEKEALDTADSASDFILTTLGAIAQEESRSISGNIRWSMQKRFPNGEVRNRALYGYRYSGEIITTGSGYRYRAVEIVEEEAEVVRGIFRLAADGVRYADIARKLNAANIPAPESFYTKRRRSRPAKGQLHSDLEEGWTARHISHMIRLERYAGDVLIQKTYTPDFLTHKARRNKGEITQYRVRNHHPAIIDRALYEKVQRVVRQNHALEGGEQKGIPGSRAFSGRLLCAECGRYYHVRNTRGNPIWYCPSTALHNGRVICHSEKIYEEQIVRMLRKAAAERFELIVAPASGKGRTADEDRRNERLPYADAILPWGHPENVDGFAEQMLGRLLDIQRFDHMERDRAFLKRQLSAAASDNEKTRCRIRQMEQQRKSMENREPWPEPRVGINGEPIETAKAKALEAERQKLETGEARERELSERARHLEEYWGELEADYEERERAISWMKGLLERQEGTAAFLNGMTGEYVKGFVRSIVVYSPWQYTVCWFDDTGTEVEMDPDREDFRRPVSYRPGDCTGRLPGRSAG